MVSLLHTVAAAHVMSVTVVVTATPEVRRYPRPSPRSCPSFLVFWFFGFLALTDPAMPCL